MTVKTVVRLAYSTSVFKNVLSRWPCIMNLITRKEFYIFFSRLDSQRGDFYDPIEYLLFRPSIWNPLITLISPIRKIDFNQFYFFFSFKVKYFFFKNGTYFSKIVSYVDWLIFSSIIFNVHETAKYCNLAQFFMFFAKIPKTKIIYHKSIKVVTYNLIITSNHVTARKCCRA